MNDKVKTSTMLDKDLDREMRIKSAEMGLRYPSEFIEFLMEKFRKELKQGVNEK